MELADKTVMVTGGAGFIGSHLVDHLLAEGVKSVIIYDNFTTGLTLNIQHLADDKRVRVVPADILKINDLERAMVDVDVVFHLGATLDILKNIDSPQEEAITNIIGTLNVLTVAKHCLVEKLILASSAGCYGQSDYSTQWEEHPLRPQWSYGVSKLAAEKYCSQFYELYEMPTVSVRYAIVYGQREWYRRVMTIFLKRALESQPIIIFGNGQQTRDFVHVHDVVRGTIRAAKVDDAVGMVINIGSGVPTSIRQLAEIIIHLTGEKTQIHYTNPDSFEDGRKPGELKHMCLNTERAKNLLDWRAVITLEDGLTRYINWLRENKTAYWGD